MGILNFAGLSIVGWVATWRLFLCCSTYIFQRGEKRNEWLLDIIGWTLKIYIYIVVLKWYYHVFFLVSRI